jgi:hypothetical protein
MNVLSASVEFVDLVVDLKIYDPSLQSVMHPFDLIQLIVNNLPSQDLPPGKAIIFPPQAHSKLLPEVLGLNSCSYSPTFASFACSFEYTFSWIFRIVTRGNNTCKVS